MLHQSLVMRATATQINFLRARAVVLDRINDSLMGERQQRSLYVRWRFAALQFAVEPIQIKQISPTAFGWCDVQIRFG